MVTLDLLLETLSMLFVITVFIAIHRLRPIRPRRAIQIDPKIEKEKELNNSVILGPDGIPLKLPPSTDPKAPKQTGPLTVTQKLLRDIENQRKYWGAAITGDPLRADTRMQYIEREADDDLFEPQAYTPDFLATQFPKAVPQPRIGRYYREPAAYTRYAEDYVQLQ